MKIAFELIKTGVYTNSYIAKKIGYSNAYSFSKAFNLGNKLKGISVLASLSVFTLIYRFATPVLITPVANWISNKINENKKAETNNKPAA